MNRRFWLGTAAYVVPTFPLAFVWHLALFAELYDSLQIYRADKIVPFGLATMVIQGAILSFAYPRLVGIEARANWLQSGIAFGLGFGAFMWSLTTLAIAAKHTMTSVPLFLALETGFTLLQCSIAGPLIALAHRR